MSNLPPKPLVRLLSNSSLKQKLLCKQSCAIQPRSLRSSESSVAGINRISSANQTVRCVLTDGTTNCWIAGDLPESK